jgi:stage II sporulation protein D
MARRLTTGVLIAAALACAAPVHAAGAPRIRVALAADQSAVTVESAGAVVVAAPGARRTIEGPLFIRREGTRVVVNEVPLRSPIRIEGESAPLALKGMVVRGALVIIARDAGLLVVNDLDLEAYVKSVVPSEVPVTWPFEALKAQAIVARTFALHKKGERGGQAFDVDATVQSQVYGGLGSEDPRASEAVDATAGIVVMHEGRLALTPYHSTSAGPTEDAAEVWGIDLPYLKGVACPFDEDSPVYRWERRLPFDDIESALREAGHAVGSMATLTPLGRNRSGRVSAVRILHSEGELILKGELLRRIIGYQRLSSMRFDVVDVEAGPRGGFDVRVRGGGWGHGVGLCQWGMKTLSERGWTADRIIDYYYPGTNLDDAARRPTRIR